MAHIVTAAYKLELGIVDSNRFDTQVDSVWRIENQRGSIRPWSRRSVALHCTAYNSSDDERKLRITLNLLTTLYISANPKEITVKKFCEYI